MAEPGELYDEAMKLRDAGDSAGLLAKLEELVAAHPDYILAHSALAVHYQKADRFDEAIAAAKKVVELNPDDPFSYAQLSVICQRCGRIAEAEEALAKGGGRPMP